MFRGDNTTFGLSPQEERERNRETVRGTIFSFAALCVLIRISMFFHLIIQGLLCDIITYLNRIELPV